MHLHQPAIEIHLCQHQVQSHLFFYSFCRVGIANYNNFRRNLKTDICRSCILLLACCSFEHRYIRIPDRIIPILLRFLLLQFGTATVCIESRGKNHVKAECSSTITRFLLDLKPPCNLQPSTSLLSLITTTMDNSESNIDLNQILATL